MKSLGDVKLEGFHILFSFFFFLHEQRTNTKNTEESFKVLIIVQSATISAGTRPYLYPFMMDQRLFLSIPSSPPPRWRKISSLNYEGVGKNKTR